MSNAGVKEGKSESDDIPGTSLLTNAHRESVDSDARWLLPLQIR